MKDRGRNLALLLLRLAGLYLALGHGWGKVASLAAGTSRFPDALAEMGFPMAVAFAWAAALSEFLGGLLIAAGLFTRVSAALCAATMFVAAVVRHKLLTQILVSSGLLERSEELLKRWGNPELATTYLLIFGALAFLGPGAWSLDAKYRKVK